MPDACPTSGRVHTKAQRSCNMSRIKGKNTKPELLLNRCVTRTGLLHCATHA
ncbi:hypothetical protein [Lacibacter sp.]|uniref:hypothetical protein n=1 Tax=Lacibacter sp. TaxID=1915409 RepID=UPI0039C97593